MTVYNITLMFITYCQAGAGLCVGVWGGGGEVDRTRTQGLVVTFLPIHSQIYLLIFSET